MASSEQLTVGNEDPYTSEGHVELRIEDFAGFIQEQVCSERFSDPVYVRGVPWNICALLSERIQPAQNGQKPKYLGFHLEYNGSTDPSRNYEATPKLKILTQKKGSVDHVFDSCKKNFIGIYDDTKLLGEMTVEELLSPAKGWYDKRSDSIVLAMDLTVDLAAADDDLGGYVLIGQNELTLDKVPMSFSLQIGNLQWQVDYDFDDQDKKEEKSLVLRCKDVETKGGRGVNNVMLEMFGYHWDGAKSEACYSPILDDDSSAVHRHLFTRSDNSRTVDIPGGSAFNNTRFTIRVLKERSQFPDFTKQTVMIGRFAADVKLLVGDQQFHANKQLISSLSPFFDRNFNGVFDAAKQQELELSLEMHSPELFHDFLLVLCVNDILPNSINVTALFKLADFYDAENVRQKCDQHLRMAREMPIEKRALLAKAHGSKETQDLIVDSASPEESKRINRLLMRNNRSL